MKNILDIGILAARAAGDYIQSAAKDIPSLTVEQKSLHDYVSEVDRNAEKIITEHILQNFPAHQIVGEEFGERVGGSDDYRWIVDPLDGTTNFLRSIPHYAISIGVMKGEFLQFGVVFDPAKNELFVASKGNGASLNGHPIKVSDSSTIKGALLSTGIPFSGVNLTHIKSFTDVMSKLLAQQTSGIRRLGAAALDLSYVAAGRYDGFWEANLNIWDLAAGCLIVQEAGGVVSDLQGESKYLETGHVVAGNPSVHADIVAVTRDVYPF